LLLGIADATLGAEVSRGVLIKRVVALVVTALCLYLVAPSLAEVFSSWPDLANVEPVWLVVMAALEAASLATIWILQWICLRLPAFGPVVRSQLAGNAFAKVAPGGGAAGAALQYRMLTDAALPPSAVGTGLTAANLLTFATLLALPVLTLPAFVAGLPVERGLVNAALLGAALFCVVAAIGGVLLASDRALIAIGRVFQRVRNRVLSRRPSLERFPELLVRERNVMLRVIGARGREALISAVLRWLLDYGALLLALAAVGAEPKPSLVLLAYTASQLLAMIPLTPGGLGFVEAGLTGLLAMAGVNAGDAAVATLGYRLVSYWLPLPAGAIAAWIHKLNEGGRSRANDRVGHTPASQHPR
jgi:putative heme transporter